MKLEKLPSGSWRARVYLGKDKSGKAIIRSITRPSKKECLADAAPIANHHRDIVMDESMLTLSEAIDRYIDMKSHILSPATIRGYRVIQRNRFQPEMNIPLKKLTNSRIQAAVNREAKTCSPKTIKNSYGFLVTILSLFDPREMNIRLPQPIPHEPNVLSKEDMKKLVEALDGKDFEIPVLIALFLGLRRSEIMALEHTDYDPKTKTLKVSKAKVPNEENQYVLKTTKTVKSTRKLSVPSYLAEKLESCIERNEPFFHVNPARITTNLKELCREINIPEMGLHDLRHQNASIMLSLGIADKYAMERGGWSSNATMKNIYQHTFTSGRQEADAMMNDFFDALH